MSFINFSTKEITFKIAYYGVGLCGKTTNILYIFDKISPESRGKLVSLATETDRTLFFDFMPVSLGELPGGFKTRFYLYTVPGPICYEESRKLTLKGADGVIFVADSQSVRREANIERLEILKIQLEANNLQLDKIPYVVQYNKRDLPSAMPVQELRSLLNPTLVPDFEAIASKGIGVFDTLKAVCKLILLELRKNSSRGA